MLLIGIAGKKGTGKDLLASFLKKKYGFINVPFAEELKAAVRRDFGLSKMHTDGDLKELDTKYFKEPIFKYAPYYGNWTPREIMIEYGKFFRKFDSLYWVKKTFEKIDCMKTFKGQDLRFTISDVRFKNEADYIKEQGGYLVRLNRMPKLNIYGQSDDESETQLDEYTGFDMVVEEEDNVIPGDLELVADHIASVALREGSIK